MDIGLELAPVPEHRRTASWLDTALLFAGANVVATTLVTGGTLGTLAPGRRGLFALIVGLVVGTLPIAVLARLGPRTGLPSMVLLRRPFGRGGAATISLLLIVTNFAWIALNDLIAARALTRIVGGPVAIWSAAAGVAATSLALTGPRFMAIFDRLAVPLMALLGVGLTWALLRRTAPAPAATTPAPFLAALDLVIAYQVSWSLMFADYTRYQRRERSASLAVLAGLTTTSGWLMLLGLFAARRGGSDPTEMILALSLPASALVVVVLSTLTTNFVNLYLSALALRNLRPSLPAGPAVLALGGAGTVLGLVRQDLLDRYAQFMGLLATLLLPIVAVALVHFFAPGLREESDVSRTGARWRLEALAAWVIGAATYVGMQALAPSWGATLPTLMISGICYYGLRRAPAMRVAGAGGGS